MDIFVFKLLLTPLFIAALTVIGRRWGSAVSGAVAGLPLTSAPVSVFLALEQGPNFAAHAATATLAGLIAVGAFCLAYAFTASRRNWAISALAGVAAFFGSASLLLFLRLRLTVTFIIVVVCVAVLLRMMPKAVGGANVVTLARPKWDILLRIAIATGLVFLLTGIAPKLGPQITGVVSPYSGLWRNTCGLRASAFRRARRATGVAQPHARIFLFRRILPDRRSDARALRYRCYIYDRRDRLSHCQRRSV